MTQSRFYGAFDEAYITLSQLGELDCSVHLHIHAYHYLRRRMWAREIHSIREALLSIARMPEAQRTQAIESLC